jgi:hypothetical protein
VTYLALWLVSSIIALALIGFRGGEVGTGSRGKGGLVRGRERG